MIPLDPAVRRRLYDWHGGQFTPTYALASSGGGNAAAYEEAESELGRLEMRLERDLLVARSNAEHRRIRGQLRSVASLIDDLEMHRRSEENPISNTALGVGVAVAAGLGALLYLIFKPAPVASSGSGVQVDVNGGGGGGGGQPGGNGGGGQGGQAPGGAPGGVPGGGGPGYLSSNAVNVILGYPIVVESGTSLRVRSEIGPWFAPPPIASSDPSVVAPSPLAPDGFMVLGHVGGPSTASVSGSYYGSDPNKITKSSLVTVIPKTPHFSRLAYDPAAAMNVTAGTAPITVKAGMSLRLLGGAWLYTSTSDASVVAPSLPLTPDGFIAVRAGTAKIYGVFPGAGGPVFLDLDVTVVP
jgi:hypothetical protein